MADNRLLAFELLLIVMTLVACGGGETDAPADVTPTATAPPPTSTPLPDGAGTAAQIKARGILRVGVRYDLQPFGYITDEGEVAGFDVDLGRELARRWLGDPQAVRFRQVRSDTAIEHLQNDDVDIIIAAFTHTQDREAGADFSLPYFIDGQALLVRAADTATIENSMSLQGRPVGVTGGGNAQEALKSMTPFTLPLQTYPRFNAAVAALGQGEVDAVADLRRRLFWGQRILSGQETAIVGQYTARPVAIAYPQSEPFFADVVNLTLQEMIADGTYAELYTRWFAPESPPAFERWPGDEVPDLAAAPVVEGAPDSISAIKTRGRLAVALATDRAPFAYVDANGTPVGYEVELVRLLAARWLGDAAAVDFLPGSVEAGKELLETGQADLLIGALPHSRASELTMDFSLTTYVAGEGLLVQAGSGIESLTNLTGRQVAVVEGSGSREVLLAALQQEGGSLTVLPQPNLNAAITLLQSGQVAAVAGDRVDLLGPAYATDGLGVLSLRLTETPLGIGLPQGDSAFRDLVNLTLQAMKVDGQLDNLYATWFYDAPPQGWIWPGAPYRELRLELATGS
jgi:putative glutamine transport system substrate-binding protein